MMSALMPRFYVVHGILTAGVVFFMFAARSRQDTVATVGWLLGSVVCVAILLSAVVMQGLMRRVRPVSRRGRHAQR